MDDADEKRRRHREYVRAWRAQKLASGKTRWRETYERDREKYAANRKRFVQANPEYSKAYYRARRLYPSKDE